jgi:hypothetical protein
VGEVATGLQDAPFVLTCTIIIWAVELIALFSCAFVEVYTFPKEKPCLV